MIRWAATQYEKDERGRLKHIEKARSSFRALVKALGPEADRLRAEFPRNVDRQKREIVKAFKSSPAMSEFLDQFVGASDIHHDVGSWRTRATYALRDAVLGVTPIKDVLGTVDSVAGNGFQWTTVKEFQAPIRKIIPQGLRDFLPATVEVEVDDDGSIKRITDRFNNEKKTMEVKIQHQKKLLDRYNEIVNRVRADLSSSDEVTRLSAIVTSIMMETGIRPGKAGNGVIRGKDGEEEFIETFGAITLGPSHVRFVRDNFAELSFVGKKGGINTAVLSDAVIIKALQDYVDNAIRTGSKFAFVTNDGYQYSYADLYKYFSRNFAGLEPTDFRKLKASETVFDAIRDEQAALYKRILAFVDLEADQLRDRVADEIAAALDRALTKAQQALSHESVETTRTQYVNPEVVFQFLSEGGLDRPFRDAILRGKTMLAFDPMKFVERATAANVRAAYLRRASGEVTLEGLLDDLALELGRLA